MLIIWNWPQALRFSDFETTRRRVIILWIVLHLVQLLLLIKYVLPE